jgi:predicted RNase H-like HicB family nuclease
MHLKVVITKGEDCRYVVPVPSLLGCIMQGKTIKEARKISRRRSFFYLEPEE